MKRALFLLVLLLVGWHQVARAADEAQERRIRIGLRLFRVTLAADEDLAHKADPAGKLLLVVFYAEDSNLAKEFAEELRQLGRGDERGTIRKVPIDVQVSNDPELKAYWNRVPAGIFLVEDLGEDKIRRLVHYGIEHHIIVYSPFEGDVDRGVLAGLAIETTVRPYINLHTLRESKIRIMNFFLKVAKHYAP